MKRIITLIALAFTLTAHAELKLGFAERDITPEVGMEVPGNYGKTYYKSIHDPCKVRVSVFDDGKNRCALIGIDALFIRRDMVLEARRRIAEKCGIPGEAVMIGASHSHSSGPIGLTLPGEFDHAEEWVRDLAYNKSIVGNPAYIARVIDAIVDGVVSADKTKVVGTAGFGSGREDTVAFNRRQRMKNGLSFSHAGAGNPDILGYAGPTDPEVGVIGGWDADGKLLGCVVNFSCHATTNGPWVSANWPCYLERAIQGYYGKDCVVVFLQGYCGDVTQVDNLSKFTLPDGDAQAQYVGGRVGAEAVKVLVSMAQTRTDEVPIATASKLLKIPRRKPAPARVEAAREIARKPEKDGGPDWVWAKETTLLDAILAREPVADVELQAIQVGPVVCLSNPAEYFVQSVSI